MRHIKEFAQLSESEKELTQELTQKQKDWLDKCVFGNGGLTHKLDLST